jgi:isopentenyl-diphosphate Delta-isomerase
MESTIDPTSESRKKDHIDMAFRSQTDAFAIDQRFYYEPIMQGHASSNDDLHKTFIGHSFKAPIWISSMTGGTGIAAKINKNLAMVCKEFGLGMGLGSCRSLLHTDEFFEDFNMRKYVGDQPLYANLGIAQVEQLIKDNKMNLVVTMIDKLQADGLIIHVNPLQEWLQPEGDRYYTPPIDTIQKTLDIIKTKLIVKEVGHGMGPKSIATLLSLPLEAIEFAAFGGTNFSKIELFRDSEQKNDWYGSLAHVGHAAEEMVDFVNAAHINLTIEGVTKLQCQHIIISGGIKTFLDGYYLINKSKINAVYGQASSFLKYAMESYEALHDFTKHQIEGLALANQLLTIK